MLVLVNGMPSTNKHIIAGHISNVINGFDSINIDGFVCDFTKQNIEISKDGKLVYRVATDGIRTVDSILETNPGVYEKAQEIFDELKYRYVHYHDFEDFSYALGIEDEIDEDFEETYESFIKKYNKLKSKYKYVVLAGTFAPTFIDRFEKDAGETINIVNIIRHPNIAYLMDDSYGYDDDDSDFFGSLKYCGDSFSNGIINVALAMKRPNVTNVKFEDILKTCKLILNGKSISIPELKDNDGTLTKKEKEVTIHTLRPDNISEVSKLVEVLTNLDKLSSQLPKDIYEELGYDKSETISNR